MMRLLHHLEAGVVLMFLVTAFSWLVIAYEMGLGLWSLWTLGLVCAYLVGHRRGQLIEMRRVK